MVVVSGDVEELPILEDEFLSFLKAQLSQVIGPLAEVMIQDEIKAMGEELNKIPHHRAADLVLFLSRKIPREGKKAIFLEVMIKKLNETKF